MATNLRSNGDAAADAAQQGEAPVELAGPKVVSRWVVLAVIAGLFVLLYLAAFLLPINEQVIVRDALRAATGVTAGVYALAAVGLNLHFGFTGLLNFGHAGFLLVGAYGMAVTVVTFGGPLSLGILVGLACSAVFALLLGIPTLRLRADYLAIVTIASAEILRLVTLSQVATPITGGPFGRSGFARTFFNFNPIPEGTYGFWIFVYSERRLWTLIIVWGLVALMSVVVFMLARSPWGRVLKSIRDDEDATRSLGKNVFAYKLQSLVIGGMIGGLAGIVWSLHLQTTHPNTFLPILTFFFFTIVILGGPASSIGPVVGAMLFWFLLQGMVSFLRQASGAGLIPPQIFGTETIGAMRFVLVGAGLVLLLIYRPQGLFGKRREMQLDA
jgi:neutral amino acid transport system permease protein